MNISYHRLFNLKISHDYYKDGLAKGVHLMPTKDTVEQLKNGRMLLKKLQVDNYLGLVAASSVIRPGVSQSGIDALENAGFEVLTTTVAQEQLENFINERRLTPSEGMP